MLFIRPVVEQLIILDGEYGDDYRTVMNIQWMGLDKIYLSGFLGEMTRAEYKEFFELMKGRGVKTVEDQRHGKYRVKEI